MANRTAALAPLGAPGTATRRTRRSIALMLVALGAILSGCGAIAPRETAVERRLVMLGTEGHALERPVTIRWNDHLVHWIEAETDGDLAYALSLVRGHRRVGQILTLRNIARGRIAEMVGPLATDLDHALRILDFGRPAPAIQAAWPAETRAFVTRFLAGLNHVILTGPRPPEAGLLGLRREPLTAADMIAMGWLAGSDINWFALLGLVARRGEPGYADRWARLREAGAGNAVPDGAGALAQVLGAMQRAGSNSVAVAPSRSASGAALITNDPHLSLALPNPFLVVGMRSPGFHMTGMMMVGTHVAVIGRSPHVAWGGTNLRAASTDIFDIAALPEAALATRASAIRHCFWFDAERPLRDSALGPVISDAALVGARPEQRLALRWAGHEPTDEVTALLRGARAGNAAEFREHMTGFGVSPLNVFYVDRAGTIGRMVATVLPSRRSFPAEDPVLDATRPDHVAPWQHLWSALDLPRWKTYPRASSRRATRIRRAGHLAHRRSDSPSRTRTASCACAPSLPPIRA
jgi:penicillin amidase